MKKRISVYFELSVLMILSILLATSCGKDELSISTVKEKEEASEKVTDNEKEKVSQEESGESRSEGIVAAESTAEEAVEEKATEDVAEENSEVSVYVCGAVVSEGVYTLAADARIEDALERAGGYSEDAAHGAINLAERLTDGMKIYFPTEQEISEGGGTWQTKDASNGSNSLSGSEGMSGSGDLSGPDGSLVNINTADAKTLETLPGIGEGKARDIINYRDTNGPFGDVQDIKNVSGIGESTFSKLSPYITVK